MLQAIRDRVTGIIAVIILGLLAIPFALVGVQNYLAPEPTNILARVGDEEITTFEFQESFNQQRRRFQQMLGNNFDPSMFEGVVPRREHLERMIDSVVLEQFASAGGIDISPQQLAESIAAIPSFQVAGQFDPQVYGNILSQIGMTVQQFEDQQRSTRRLTELEQGLSGSALTTPEEINRAIHLRNETRHIRFLEIAAEPYRENIEITEEDISAYYGEHGAEFTTEEQVVINYLEVNVDEYAQDVPIAEETLRDRYDQQQGRFVTPERRLTSHILLNAPTDDEAAEEAVRQQAEELAKRAQAGEPFEDLAKEFSEDPGSANSGGDLGWVEEGVMVAAFEEALFAMAAGTISDPVKSSFGYHIIWLREVDESHGQSFEEVRGELRQEVALEQAQQTYDEVVGQISNITYEQTDSLEFAAEEGGLEVKTSTPFGRTGGPGIASYPEVVREAYTDLVLLDGMNSDPIQVGTDHVVFIRLNEHRPSRQRPLEDVSEEIRSILVQQRASAQAEEAALALVDSLSNAAEDFDAVAEARETPLTVMEQLSRRDFQLGADFLDAVFKLPADEDGAATYHAVPRNQQDWAVVALHGVTPGAAEQAEEATRQQLQREIANAYSTQELTYLVQQLRSEAKIQVYEDRL